MAIASVSTRASSCFPPCFQQLRRSSRVSYLPTSSHSNFIGASASASSLGFSFKVAEHNLFLAPLGSKRSSLLAIVDDTTALPSDPMAELSFSGNSNEAYPFKESVGRNVEFEDADGDQNCVCDHKMIRVCDKLIDVFMVDKPAPTDWRRLLAFSREWNNIRPHFFRRCQERADAEGNPDMKPKLLRLGRKLKEIDEDVQRHNELLEAIESSPLEIGELVSRRRKDFTKEFFVHLHTVAESYYDNPIEQNAMAKLGNACLAAVQDYDNASESMEALHAAELKFQDIINSSTLNVACEKIDSLAEKNQLDSTLVLLITKAWSAAKDSKMMKEEVYIHQY
ncbi:hypothetical protein Syun_004023 [Stephania yunnanensis]|uniref:Uncharacterized protein n=1 Tax=Stephania yunnanensis TaxID=152371 RepID=A0AAP0Q4H7_9MAGN